MGGARGRRGARASARSCSCSRPTGPRSCCRSRRVAIAFVYPFFKRFFVAAAGVPRHRVLVRHPDGVRRGATTRCRRSRGGCCCSTCSGSIAYDTEYAMVDRDDDVRLGLRTSAIAFGRFDVARGDALLRDLSRRHGGGRACALAMGPLYYAGLAVGARLRRVSLDGSSARATASAASARSCTTTGSGSPCSPASRSITRVRVAAWPRRAVSPERARCARRGRAETGTAKRGASARAAAGARARHARADPRQLSRRGVARRRPVLRASAQPLLAARRRR